MEVKLFSMLKEAGKNGPDFQERLFHEVNNTGLIGLSNTSEVKTMSSLEIADLIAAAPELLDAAIAVIERCH